MYMYAPEAQYEVASRRPKLRIPTGLASRFDNGNPHGFSGFVEANSRCYLSQFWAAVPR